jgi:hypothetical protein
MLRARLPCLAVLAIAVAAACSGFREDAVAPGGDAGVPGADAQAAGDAPPLDPDAAAPDGARSDAGPPGACKTLPLECLDPSPANVIEVPGEGTLASAIAGAKAGDTIQVKGLAIPAGYTVPAFTTLRGCQGARIDAPIVFAGSGGTVEGFEVKGSVVANKTGTYLVRHNRFVGGGAANEAGVSGRSVDALVSATVTLVVDANAFEGRAVGVEARTNYDTMTHTVDITVRNNVFARVPAPFVASESGLVGIVTAKIEHNTFFDFQTAIALYSVDRRTTVSGNLLATGTTGVGGGSPYDLTYSFAWQVTTPAGTPPVSGTFASGDPAFVDPQGFDFRLGPGSAVVDRVPNGVAVPGEDYRGCPRPAGPGGAAPASDVGAIEMQP